MDIITPITITDTILIGSNVPENDATEYDPTSTYSVGNTAMVATYAANVHKTYENLVAQSAGLTADLLDDDCSSLDGWTSGDTGIGGGVSEVSPAGQFRFDTNTSAAGNYVASRTRTIATPPNTHTIEIKTYFDAIGDSATQDYFYLGYEGVLWIFHVRFFSDGLYIRKAAGALGEVGTNIVKCNATAAWQTWRFQVDKTTESAATVAVYLKEEGGEFALQGTVDCDYETAGNDGKLTLTQFGYTTDNRISHVDYVKVATGLGQIVTVGASPVGNTDWLEVDSTNRWKAFNGVLGSQTEQATKIEYVLAPGQTFDSVASMNLASDTVDIIVCDTANNLVTNGESWTGASGTTQPTGWDKIGTPSAFAIEGGRLKITTAAANEGISQTITVVAATEYQLVLKYEGGVVDAAAIAVYDMTHSANILAQTALPFVNHNSSYSYVFTTPAGCISLKISLIGVASTYSVYFDSVVLAPTDYSETVTTGTTKTDVVKLDLPGTATSILTVTVNQSTTAKIGELIIGTKTSLGATLASPAPKVSIADYSSQSQDAFGNWTIVQRGYAKKLTCSTKIEATETLTVRQNSDYIFGVLSACRSLMRVWIGDENLSCMIIYGKYDSFELELTCNNLSLLDLDILGMI